MSGTDLARAYPEIAARLVANPQADTQNAWEVLVSAWGVTTSTRMVLDVEGGADALQRIVGDPYPLTFEQTDKSPEAEAMRRHLIVDHEWEVLDNLFTVEQARKLHADYHARPDFYDEPNPNHTHDGEPTP